MAIGVFNDLLCERYRCCNDEYCDDAITLKRLFAGRKKKKKKQKEKNKKKKTVINN